MTSIIPNPLYIPLFNIEEVILDKDTGLPLANGVVNFYRDSQRLTPKNVYKISGSSPNYTFVNMGSTFTLGIDGSFVDENGDSFVPYAYPYTSTGSVDLYYVTVESEGGVSQFTREAVPYIGEDVIPPEDRVSTANELLNSQFVEILFPSTASSPFVINVTGSNTVTPIAPYWDIITTGTGTISVERLEPTSSSTDTNPPYALQITADSALGSTFVLRQRLMNSPSIGRGGYASGTLVARIVSGGASAVSMQYAPSVGTSTFIIPSTSIATDGSYDLIQNNALIPQQNNTAATTGYVDINITLPTSRTIAISSLQVVFTPTSINIPFDQQTASLQKSDLFSYYQNSILNQPKKNLLVGWTFAQNPWQFVTKTDTTVTNQTQYICDQTILHQETASALTSGQGGGGIQFGLQLFAINGVTANRFALIQYLDYTAVASYWGQKLSCLVRCGLFTANSTQTKLKMRLIYRTAGDAVPTLSNSEPITGWNSDKDVTFSTGWSEIEPLNDPAYLIENLTPSTPQDDLPAYAFNQFQLPQAVSNNMYLGVVIYITDPISDALGDEDVIAFSRVSLVPNDVAIDASPESFDETLKRCQFYYEKSYAIEDLPGTVTNDNILTYPQIAATAGLNTVFWPHTFTINYKNIKRSDPSVTIYSSATGTSGQISTIVAANSYNSSSTADYAISNFASYQSTNFAAYNPNAGITFGTSTGSAASPQSAYALLHYTADARLGI